jgi:hypothetical protein
MVLPAQRDHLQGPGDLLCIGALGSVGSLLGDGRIEIDNNAPRPSADLRDRARN